jgi:transcriptional regulator with XRE-family HTH domain
MPEASIPAPAFSLPLWRSSLGLTQQQAAEVLGLHLRTLQRYERPGADLPRSLVLACDGLALRATLKNLLSL